MEVAKEIVKIIDEAIIGEEKDEKIWFLLLKTMQAINDGKIIDLGDFQKNLIKLLGYDPEQMKNLEDLY